MDIYEEHDKKCHPIRANDIVLVIGKYHSWCYTCYDQKCDPKGPYPFTLYRCSHGHIFNAVADEWSGAFYDVVAMTKGRLKLVSVLDLYY